MQFSKSSKLIIFVLLLVVTVIFTGCGGGGTTPPINHSPTITSITASPQSPIEVDQSTVITCSASDPDGDPLVYTWTKTGGTITGTGSAITWTAPDIEGTYIITCIVSDGELTDEQSISIDVEQELPPDTTEPEFKEVVSEQIDLEVGGLIEVTDESSEIYGTRLVIDPVNKGKQITERGLNEIGIILVSALTNEMLDNQGFLITPVAITADTIINSIIDIISGTFEIAYNEDKLSNSGVAKNSSVNAYRLLAIPVPDPNNSNNIIYLPVPGVPWEKVPEDKITHENNKVKISIDAGYFCHLYTLTVTNCEPPDNLGNPLPGDLIYRLSFLGPNDNWLPGHVGIYVGERYHEEDGVYNVIEQVRKGVERSYFPDITYFGNGPTYMGAREPATQKLSHSKRNKVIEFAEDKVGMPYAIFETFGVYFGWARGNNVKGANGSYNCVGLAEAAYESEYVEVDIVSDYDEGNQLPFYDQDAILTPQEQLYRTVPASGIIDQNTPPEISNLEVIPEGSVNTNSIVFITCNATDQDNDNLTYIWTIPEYGNYTTITKGKSISWGSPNEEGTYIISCKVIDNYGGEDEKSINISVGDINLNHPPVISSLTANPSSIDINQTTTITCTASDQDGDTLTYTWTKTGGTFEGSTTGSSITWRAPSAEGNYTVECEVSDGEASDSDQVIISVGDVNHPPVITSSAVTAATKGELYSYDVNATDPDGDIPVYSLTTNPNGMIINSSTGLISWTPTTSGEYNVTVKVSDGELSASQSFTITVGVEGDYVVEFEDPNFEQVVRETINKPSGPIYLSDVIGITLLEANERGIVSLEGIQHLENLHDLLVFGNQVSDISALSNLINLQHLDLAYNQVSDISALSNLTNLQHLDLEYNQVSDISVLSNLTNLQWLRFQSNQVSDISVLSNLTNLQYLYFYGNQVSDISALQNLTNLHDLNFDYNQVSDISVLSNLTNLQYLIFYGNQVSDISALQNLTNLRRLNFVHNQVSDISALSNLTNLQHLDLAYNQVSDISALSNLTNLQWLRFPHNQVSDISALSNLTNLHELNFDYNQVSDISALVNNEGFGSGDIIGMEYNYLDLTAGSQNMQDIENLISRGVDVDYIPQRFY